MKYLWLWLTFSVVFTFAALGLELLEGNKITTTEYYGLRNLGGNFIMFCTLYSIFLYLITFLPLTFLCTRFVRLLLVNAIIYTAAGGAGGLWVFDQFYGLDNEYFVAGYGLEKNSAVILFSLAGLVYAGVDGYLERKSG